MNSIKTTILYLVFLIALIGILLSLLILPVIGSINDRKSVLLKQQNDFKSQEQRSILLKTMQKDSTEFQMKVNKAGLLWPDEKEVSAFIVDLENLANALGLNLKNVSISENAVNNKNSSKKKQIQFSFDTKADFAKNMAVIASLEKFSRFNSIRQISLNKDNDGLVMMKITGSIYYGQ